VRLDGWATQPAYCMSAARHWSVAVENPSVGDNVEGSARRYNSRLHELRLVLARQLGQSPLNHGYSHAFRHVHSCNTQASLR
jgi:hypothetical protein